MKKILVSIVAISALTLALTFGVKTSSHNNRSLLAANNVEALTDEEEDDKCPNGCKACGSLCHCFKDYYWLREGNE